MKPLSVMEYGLVGYRVERELLGSLGCCGGVKSFRDFVGWLYYCCVMCDSGVSVYLWDLVEWLRFLDWVVSRFRVNVVFSGDK